MPTGATRRDPEDFSLVLGGPLYQFFLRTRLVRPLLDLVHRRIAALTLLAWLPLLILTAIAGTLSQGVSVPFFQDLDVHARLLVSLTLLVWAEPFVHRSLAGTVRQFMERDLIAAEDRERFEKAVAAVMRLRNSVPLEIAVLAIAVLAGRWLGTGHMSVPADAWYGRRIADGVQLTVAGYWYTFVSLSLFRFLLLRWYFRLALWYRLLWLTSRFNLGLNALHPDRAGGIGFLGQSAFAFAPVFVAQTVLASAVIGDDIWHEGASLPTFKLEIAVIVAILLLLSLAPLCVFVGPMARAKRVGRREYGTQASHYVNEFRRKCLKGDSGETEPFLGSADIQSLADLANSYGVVTEMRLFPIGPKSFVLFALIVISPFLPLILTMIPLDEIVGRLLKIAF
jgi:hypothetical protein